MFDRNLHGFIQRSRSYPTVLSCPNSQTAPSKAHALTQEILKPKHAIPMHYGTNPLLIGTPEENMDTPTKIHNMKPGDTL